MARLIDAEWLLRLVCGRKCGCNPDGCGCEDYHECEIGAYIKESPTVDAVPVVHGRWIEQEKYTFGTMYDCSICNTRILDNGHSWNYCPNCGARMIGGEADATD